MEDKFQEECGVVGVFGHPEAANLVYLGLYALQHRGQESAGIVSSDGAKVHVELGTGLVADVFNEERLLQLPGKIAVGHNRYSTTGESLLKNAQPCLIEYRGGPLALAHNGNLVNADSIRFDLESSGSIFQSTNDSEVILHLIAKNQNSKLIDNVSLALSQIKGAYSLLILSKDGIIAARDPSGFRPLCLGKLNGAYILASETCVMDLVNAEYIREIEPGEIIQINNSGLQSFSPLDTYPQKTCVFEHIYFARPDSQVFGEDVYQTRKNMGRALAEEWPAEADIVIPVPDSGNISALGYSEQLKIPFEMGLIRNHYVGRTFIEPQSQIRDFGVRVKLNAVKNIVKGKRVVIIDDSIVRGTTSRKIVKMVRSSGATAVHVRISSPPSLFPCFYGIDTPTKQELIAASKTVEETRDYIMADSLQYISLEKMMSVFKNDRNKYCKACFDGEYPISKDDIETKSNQMDLFKNKT